MSYYGAGEEERAVEAKQYFAKAGIFLRCSQGLGSQMTKNIQHIRHYNK